MKRKERPTPTQVRQAVALIPPTDERIEQQNSQPSNQSTSKGTANVSYPTPYNSDQLPFDEYGKELSLDQLARNALTEAETQLGYEQPTMPLDECANQWLLLTKIEGPFRVPSNFSQAPDGKMDVLQIEVIRNLDDNLQGTVERLTIGQQVLMNVLSGGNMRAAVNAGIEFGVRFNQSTTKDGKRKLWLLKVCQESELRDKIAAEG